MDITSYAMIKSVKKFLPIFYILGFFIFLLTINYILRVDNIDYEKLAQSVVYNPDIEYPSGKSFFRDENLFLNDPVVKEIYDLPNDKLVLGDCIPYGYDSQNKIFISTDGTHPRYGGSSGRTLGTEESQKVLVSLLKVRKNVSKDIGHILYCALYTPGATSYEGRVIYKNTILISESSKDQPNKDIFVGLLNDKKELIGGVQLKISEDGYIVSIDPIAYNFKDNIFYFKLSGKLNNGDVNLFKIYFNNNSYKIIYQGK